jgi:hypothetical protein
MTEPLHTLAYFSRNAIDDIGLDLTVELSNILASARRNNGKLGLTGALIFSTDCFAQVLEGPLSSIERIFEDIECDPRHRDVTVLHFKPAVARSFAEWSMAFARVPRLSPEGIEIRGALASPAAIGAHSAGRDLITILQDLIARHAAVAGEDQDWPAMEEA